MIYPALFKTSVFNIKITASMSLTIPSFIQQIQTGISQQSFIKMVIGNKRNKADEVKNIAIKLIDLKDEDVLAKRLNDNGVLAMIWPMLCDLSHNNLNALARRHFPDHGSGEKKLIVFSPLDAQLRSLILTKQLIFLVSGLESLRSSVKASCIVDFDQSMEKINVIWLAALEIEGSVFEDASDEKGSSERI